MNKPFYGVATMPKSQRTEIVNNPDVPGPGSYNFNKQRPHNQLPKWSLKKRLDHGSCFQELSISPGPGGYESSTAFNKKAELKIEEKGQKYRHFLQKSYSHSPLNLPGAFNLKGGHSFGYREAFKQVETSPGPIYHLDNQIEQKRKIKTQNSYRGFGFGQKNNHIYKRNQKTPGPGAFQVENATGMAKSKTYGIWTFGSGKRSNQLIKGELGPGEYQPQLFNISRSFKFRGRNQIKPAQINSNGPGTYDIPDTKTKLGTLFHSPKKVEKQEQSERSLKKQSSLSPFSYNPPRYLDKPDNHGYSLGQRIDLVKTDQLEQPGPGAYQIIVKKNENRAYMGRKLEEQKVENAMDNFYKYDPKISTVTRQSPKFSFPQSRRYRDKQNGQHTTNCPEFYLSIETKKSGCSYSMGTSKRFVEQKKEQGPFKLTQETSTIGQMPSYLRKSSKKV